MLVQLQRLLLCLSFIAIQNVGATVLTFGDKDILGLGTYGSEPTAGATLEGLAANVVTTAALEFNHGFPFDPEVDDFAGTDQIFVGSTQTAFGDGYSAYANRQSAPHVVSLDYSSLIGTGEKIDTFTLGIAADDFQFPLFGQLFSAGINGVENTALSAKLNALDQTGPQVQFFTIGIDPLALSATHILSLGIDQAGDGRDGWAIDFLTVGVTTSPVPLPPAMLLMASAILWARVRYRRIS